MINTPEIVQHKETYSELLDTIKREPTSVLVGAGISNRAGYPLWGELLELLLNSVRLIPGNENFEPKHETDLKKAQEFQDELGDSYYDLIFDRFTNEEEHKLLEFVDIHTYLMAITQFKCIVTTNYDTCLERAREIPSESWFPNLNPADIDKNLVYHLHGYIDAGNQDSVRSIVLSENDYEIVYDPRHDTYNFLLNYFQNFNVVFLGFSMEDESVMAIMKYVNEAIEYNNRYPQNRGRPRTLRKHFALLPLLNKDTTGFDQSLNDLGVRVIRYSATQYFPENKDIVKHMRGFLNQDDLTSLEEKSPDEAVLEHPYG